MQLRWLPPGIRNAKWLSDWFGGPAGSGYSLAYHGLWEESASLRAHHAALGQSLFLSHASRVAPWLRELGDVSPSMLELEHAIFHASKSLQASPFFRAHAAAKSFSGILRRVRDCRVQSEQISCNFAAIRSQVVGSILRAFRRVRERGTDAIAPVLLARRIRVCVVTAFAREHSASKMVSRLLLSLSRSEYNITTIATPGPRDATGAVWRRDLGPNFIEADERQSSSDRFPWEVGAN